MIDSPFKIAPNDCLCFTVVIPDDVGESQSSITEPLTQKSDDSGYFGNLLWSPLEKLAVDFDPLSCYSPAHNAFSTIADHGIITEESLTLEQLLRATSPKTVR